MRLQVRFDVELSFNGWAENKKTVTLVDIIPLLLALTGFTMDTML